MYPWFWIILLVVLLIVEGATLSLTTIWFAGGALAAAIVSFIWDERIPEYIVFFAVSLTLLFFIRPAALRRFNRRRFRSNVEGVVGKTVRILEKVDNLSGTGRAKVDGMEWAAASTDANVTFEADELAVVDRVEGVKLIIRKQ